MKNDDNKKRGSSYIEFALLGMVGTQLVASIFIGFGVGYWLDKLFNTSPVFLLLFTFFGVAAGFLNVYRMIKKER